MDIEGPSTSKWIIMKNRLRMIPGTMSKVIPNFIDDPR